MNKLYIVAKTEFYRYFTTPIALVYLICFLFLNGSCACFLGIFFVRGQANLLPMFGYLPWILLLFVPAVAMRMWAEEFKNQTIRQLVTLPINISTLVWGKFWASWLFCIVALFLTFPFWVSVNILGDADNGVICAGYIATVLLSGAMLAIAQTMSALTKNQVIALVLGVLANLLFLLSGIEFVLGNIRSLASNNFADLIASFSFITHFENITLGLLELRDIIFFITVILLFNLITIGIISLKTVGANSFFKSANRSYYVIFSVFLIILFIGINMLSNVYLRQLKFDFTEENIFTLTDASKNVIKNIKGNVYIKMYYSPILGEKNPEVRLLADKINMLLEEFAKLSDGKIIVKKYNPIPFSDAEDRALAAGLQALPVIDKNHNAYLGLVLTDEYNNKQVIPYFPIARTTFIEQELTEALYLLNNKKPNLGIITSLPIFESTINNVVTPEWEISKQLAKYYNLFLLSQDNPDLSNIDILMMMHPTDLTSLSINQIMNFSKNGGKILAFFDVATEAQQLFAPTTQEFIPSDYKKLTDYWGIKFIKEAVIADLDNSSLVNNNDLSINTPDFTQDVIQFYVENSGFNKKSPITANLQKMLLTSVSTIVPLKNANTVFEPLIVPSANSALMRVEAVYERISPAIILRNFKKDDNPKFIAAHIKGKDEPLEVIVVTDTDLLYDNFWTTHQNVLENSYAVPLLDNANFVLNALDYLRGDQTLLTLRGKNYKERKFENLEKNKIKTAKDFKIKEKEILDNLAKAKKGMTEIAQKRNFEGRNIFTPDELAVIAKIRKKIHDDRIKLYNIRSKLTADEENLKNRLIWINIYMFPLIGIGLLLIPLIFKKREVSVNSNFKINVILVKIGIISVLELIAGLTAYRIQENKYADKQENELVFPKLNENINNVASIVLQNSSEKLEFIKNKNGIWTLPEYPHYLVYNNRIRNLLSNLITATYYEKKSSDFSSLDTFGLSPIEDHSSDAVKISLYDSNKKAVAEINIGHLDIELGRGSRGAYIRKQNSFSVWLAQTDLVDLNLSPKYWTYSNLWNLQFGRLISANGNANQDILANLAKELLNIYFIDAKTEIQEDKIYLSVNIETEKAKSVILNFYKVNNTYWVKYNFNGIVSSDLLQDFANYAKGVFYKISFSDMERIKNATQNINNRKQ